MTKLSDYLRAEQPDYTEPVSFYIPGAHSWHGRKPRKPTEPPPPDLTNEDVVLIETDVVDADELEAVESDSTARKNSEEL